MIPLYALVLATLRRVEVGRIRTRATRFRPCWPRHEHDPERPGRSPVPVRGLVAECIYPPTGRMVRAYAAGAAGLSNGLFARKRDVHMAAETLGSIVNLHAAAQLVNDPTPDET